MHEKSTLASQRTMAMARTYTSMRLENDKKLLLVNSFALEELAAIVPQR